jgi:hypothetical protein
MLGTSSYIFEFLGDLFNQTVSWVEFSVGSSCQHGYIIVGLHLLKQVDSDIIEIRDNR